VCSRDADILGVDPKAPQELLNDENEWEMMYLEYQPPLTPMKLSREERMESTFLEIKCQADGNCALFE
jgi:hypothetical protein